MKTFMLTNSMALAMDAGRKYADLKFGIFIYLTLMTCKLVFICTVIIIYAITILFFSIMHSVNLVEIPNILSGRSQFS